jgi:excisionase family DNA binding protein
LRPESLRLAVGGMVKHNPRAPQPSSGRHRHGELDYKIDHSEPQMNAPTLDAWPNPGGMRSAERLSDLSFTERLATAQRGRARADQRTEKQRPGRIEAPPAPAVTVKPLWDEFLTVKEVASILRFTGRWVRSLIEKGEIKADHFGTAVRITRTNLQKYIDGCRERQHQLS